MEGLKAPEAWNGYAFSISRAFFLSADQNDQPRGNTRPL